MLMRGFVENFAVQNQADGVKWWEKIDAIKITSRGKCDGIVT